MASVLPRSFSYIASVLFLLTTRSLLAVAKSVVIPMESTNYGTSLNIGVDIGGKTYNIIPDSGSADLWIFEKGNCKCSLYAVVRR